MYVAENTESERSKIHSVIIISGIFFSGESEKTKRPSENQRTGTQLSP